MMSAALLRRAVVQHVHQISSLRSHVHASQTRGSLHSIALQCHSFGGSRQSVSVRRMQRPLSETNVRRFTRTSMIVQSSYTAVERVNPNRNSKSSFLGLGREKHNGISNLSLRQIRYTAKLFDKALFVVQETLFLHGMIFHCSRRMVC